MHRPSERIESENTQFHVVVTVGTASKQEFGELRDVMTEKRDFLVTDMSVSER